MSHNAEITHLSAIDHVAEISTPSQNYWTAAEWVQTLSGRRRHAARVRHGAAGTPDEVAGCWPKARVPCSLPRGPACHLRWPAAP